MSQDITPFEFGPNIQWVEKDGQRWMVLNDFCLSIGLTKSSARNYASKLPKEVVHRADVLDSRGVSQETNIVNARGARYILRDSNKKIPKGYQNWLGTEVADSLAEDGGFIFPFLTTEQVLRLQGKIDYVKINNGLAAATDYDPKSTIARWFFADVRNAFLEAVTGMQAKQIVARRDGEIVTWTGKTGPTKEDKKVAMNYLDADEQELFALFLTNAMTQTMLRFHKKSYTMAEYLSAIRKSVILS